MLQKIEKPSSGLYNIIARCPETEAVLNKSRAQYTLIFSSEEEYITRHWSRRKVLSDADAIERANKSLAKILERDG